MITLKNTILPNEAAVTEFVPAMLEFMNEVFDDGYIIAETIGRKACDFGNEHYFTITTLINMDTLEKLADSFVGGDSFEGLRKIINDRITKQDWADGDYGCSCNAIIRGNSSIIFLFTALS